MFRPMRRGLVLLILLSVLAAMPAAAATKHPGFALGTYKGKTSLHGSVSMRIYKGHCDRVRQNLTQVSGYCFVITKLTPVPHATCTDPNQQQNADEVTLEPYGSQPEKIHLAANGHYRDAVETYNSSGSKPASVVTLTFTAKARTVTGKVTIKSGGDGQGAYACSAPAMTFKAKR
jgi:hypothetical protein